MVLGFSIAFAALGIFLDTPTLAVFNLSMSIVTIFTIWLNQKGIIWARMLFSFALILDPLTSSIILDQNAGVLIIYIPIIAGQFLLFDFSEIKWSLTGVILSGLCMFLLEYTDYELFGWHEKAPKQLQDLHFRLIVASSSLGTILSFVWLTRNNHKAEELLRSANVTATNASNAKSEFLSMMSHEIRTPLHGIVGITDILLSEEGLSKKSREDTKVLKYAANNLVSIVNDILDYSKLEAGKVRFEKVSFDIRDLCEKIERSLNYKIEKKQLSFSIEINQDVPKLLCGDPLRLTQILTNLLDNALKFTVKGEVNLTIKVPHQNEGSAKLSFQISDTGIGIPQDRLDWIMESFTQASPITTREFGGTGLGVSICKRLIEQQKGTLKVQSKEGEGSTFSFDLEYAIGILAPENDNIDVIDEKTVFNGLKVLMVEDNLINQFVTKQLLQSLSIQFNVVESGERAIEVLREVSYDIVLMDYHLPSMDGLEATRIIRDTSSGVINPSIPVIIITADVIDTVKSHILSQGATEFVAKPLDRPSFIQKLYKIVKAHNIEFEKPQQTLNFVMGKKTQHIDLDYISKIIGNDHKVIKQLFTMVMQKTPDHLLDLKSSYIKNDHKQMALVAQNMKSNFKNIGAFTISNIMANMEEGLKDKSALETVDTSISEFEIKYKEAQEEIYDWMNSN